MSIQDFVAGFALGLSLIIAIGAQNIFVIQRGILRSHVFSVCMFCALSDALLISAGVFGFGGFLDQLQWIEPVTAAAGAAFLIGYGALSAWRAFTSQSSLDLVTAAPVSLTRVLGVCFALTWLNPHVYLDTVIILGTVSTQYDSQGAFAIGAILSSFAFFFPLGYGARALAPALSKPLVIRMIDLSVAVIMWVLAVKILLG